VERDGKGVEEDGKGGKGWMVAERRRLKWKRTGVVELECLAGHFGDVFACWLGLGDEVKVW